MEQFKRLELSKLSTPCFVVDEHAVENNLRKLKSVADQSGAKILCALKAFSMWRLAPLISRYLTGTCASGIHEATLGREEYGGEIHVFSAAFSEQELRQSAEIADHIVLNSTSQWQTYTRVLRDHKHIQVGIRVNPEHSEGTVPLYDPCSPESRLGVTLDELNRFLNKGGSLEGISGLHFHTLCEQGFIPLARTLAEVEKKFAGLLNNVKWVNFGGGHHITQSDYDVEGLIKLIQSFSAKYDVQVYLEPGEAIAINTGVLVAEVLDIRGKDEDQVILDTSATCHMPDVLEMPYRPEIMGAGKKNEKRHNYLLGGMTCLAGDSLGWYSFEHPLALGQRLVFLDMSHYTMVKTTTFNGINLPSIYVWNAQTEQIELVKSFGYSDFKRRLS